MAFTNVLKTNIYIKELLSVAKSFRNGLKNPVVTKRGSDAFVFVLSGDCTYECEGGVSFNAREGDIIYLARGSNYVMTHKNSNLFSYFVCNFNFDSDEPRLCALVSPQKARGAESLFARLYRAYSRSSDSSFTEAVSILYSIYSIMLSDSARAYVSTAAREKLLDAKNHIDDSFTDPSLSVAEVAERFDMSDVYFRKLFRMVFGVAPSQYIISKRLSNAEALMLDNTLSIEDCALQSGFSTVQYFCRIYKAKRGISPGKSR